MKLSETIQPIAALKNRTAELIRQARDTSQPIVITQKGKATAVLQDIDSFERDHSALLPLRYLAQRQEEIDLGRGIRKRTRPSRRHDP
jgi:prevent-host-death family protein